MSSWMNARTPLTFSAPSPACEQANSSSPKKATASGEIQPAHVNCKIGDLSAVVHGPSQHGSAATPATGSAYGVDTERRTSVRTERDWVRGRGTIPRAPEGVHSRWLAQPPNA